jgi:hypothetical protein
MLSLYQLMFVWFFYGNLKIVLKFNFLNNYERNNVDDLMWSWFMNKWCWSLITGEMLTMAIQCFPV